MYSPLDVTAATLEARTCRSQERVAERYGTVIGPYQGRRRGEEHGRENANRNLSGDVLQYSRFRTRGTKFEEFVSRTRIGSDSRGNDNCTVGTHR